MKNEESENLSKIFEDIGIFSKYKHKTIDFWSALLIFKGIEAEHLLSLIDLK